MRDLLLHGDCLEIMNKIENHSIDMILCDLPYETTKLNWDKIIPFDKLWNHYKRIIKPDGAILLFGQEPFSSHLRLSNLKWYKYDLYWKKERITNIFQVKRRAGKNIENISVFYKNQCTYNPQKTIHIGDLRSNKVKGNFSEVCASNKIQPKEYIDDGTRYPTQLLEFNRDFKSKDRLHPTQKPIELLEYLIKTYSNKGDLILDNCAGSGSTAIACLNLDRNFIMIEKDNDFFKIMKNRLTNYSK